MRVQDPSWARIGGSLTGRATDEKVAGSSPVHLRTRSWQNGYAPGFQPGYGGSIPLGRSMGASRRFRFPPQERGMRLVKRESGSHRRSLPDRVGRSRATDCGQHVDFGSVVPGAGLPNTLGRDSPLRTSGRGVSPGAGSRYPAHALRREPRPSGTCRGTPRGAVVGGLTARKLHTRECRLAAYGSGL